MSSGATVAARLPHVLLSPGFCVVEAVAKVRHSVDLPEGYHTAAWGAEKEVAVASASGVAHSHAGE